VEMKLVKDVRGVGEFGIAAEIVKLVIGRNTSQYVMYFV